MNFKVTIGKSQKKNVTEAAQEAALACLREAPFYEEGVVLVFTTVDFASIGLLKNIKLILKTNLPIIGCSGLNIIDAGGATKEGIVIAVISAPQIKISSGAINAIKNQDIYSSAQELGKYLLSNVKEYRRELCLLFTDGLSEDISALIKGLQNTLGKSFPFIGGGSSDNLKFRQTFQYYNDEILSNGAVAALFAGKLSYAIGIGHGWKPLGKIRAITESRANVIKKIDNKKAILLYEDYFAKTLNELKKEILHINILYPLGIYVEGENEYLLRNVISLNEDGSITTQGDIPEGSSVRLMIGTKESCLAAAKEAGNAVNSALNERINLAIVISSVSRACILGRNLDSEIKIIKETLKKDTPIVGFYSYGEYAPLGSLYGQTYLHNQTIAILGIGE